MTLRSLGECVGSWTGRSQLRDPEYGVDEDSRSDLAVVPVLAGRFVRLDYAWEYRGKPQEGSILVGQDPGTAACHAYWVDSWHTGHSGMLCEGAGTERAIAVRGSYPAPPGPDWGWRIEIAADPDAALRVTMFNVSPEGHEELAVSAVYTRSGPGKPQTP